jgi:general nucleoside transport system permease protein
MAPTAEAIAVRRQPALKRVLAPGLVREVGRRGFRVLVIVARQAAIVAIALLIGGGVLEVSGFSAPEVYHALLTSVLSDYGTTVRWATPLMLTGLGAALAFKGQIWNIGLDGQLYVGALAGTAVGLFVPAVVPSAAGLGTVLLASVVAGAAWALVPALLRLRWGAPEIITTFLLIQVASLLGDYFVLGPLHGTGNNAATLGTNNLPERLALPGILAPSNASIGFFIALGVALAVIAVVLKTTYGYALRVYGSSPGFAFYGGVPNQRIFISTMLASGGLAGLAGGLEVTGVLHSYLSGFDPNLGFIGMEVALLARLNPVGVLVAAFFFGALQTGGADAQLLTDAPTDIVNILSALIVFGIAAQFGFRRIRRLKSVRGGGSATR